MTEISRDTLKELASVDGWPCVSVYMPVHAGASDARQDPIRLRNLLDQAWDRLVAGGCSQAEARAALEAARALTHDGSLERGARGKGLALLLSPGALRRFDLPFAPAEAVRVGNALCLRPLLGAHVGGLDHFYVLAVTPNGARLVEATRESAREVPLEGAPRSVAEMLGRSDPQRIRGAHGDGGGRGDHGSSFHGSAPEPSASADLVRFFRVVDHAARAVLGDRAAPVVLACVDHVAPVYREASGLAHLCAAHAPGSPEGATPAELRDRALPVIDALEARALADAAARYRRHAGSGRASPFLSDAVAAALGGRVDTLFFEKGAERWGELVRGDGTFDLHAEPRRDDVDLVDLAAVRTLATGGTVFALERGEMPADSEVAVLLRY